MDRIRIKEALVVEGKYDKNTLSQLVDAPIFVTEGFGIFKDPEKLALLRAAAEKRGLIVLTDSDGAGLVIRNHLKGAIDPALVKHAYIPDVFGKEKRKAAPGKEGKLGVEGMTPAVLLQALRNAGATFENEEGQEHCSGAHRCATESASDAAQSVGTSIACPVCEANNRPEDDPSQPVGARNLPPANRIRSECRTSTACPYGKGGTPITRPTPQGATMIDGPVGASIARPAPQAPERNDRTSDARPYESITKTDLYELGLTGRPDSKERRRALQKALALPENLSTNALLTALNCLYTKEELEALLWHPESSTWQSPVK